MSKRKMKQEEIAEVAMTPEAPTTLPWSSRLRKGRLIVAGLRSGPVHYFYGEHPVCGARAKRYAKVGGGPATVDRCAECHLLACRAWATVGEE